MRLQIVPICVTLFLASMVGASAGSASSGGPQIGPTDGTSVGTYKITNTSVSASAQSSSAGATQSAAASTSASDSASSNSAAAGTGNGTAAGTGASSGATDGSGRRSKDPNDASIEIKPGEEKVIDTGDKPVANEKMGKAASTDKKFSSGLLDSVSDISKLRDEKADSAIAKTEDSLSKSASAPASEKETESKKNN